MKIGNEIPNVKYKDRLFRFVFGENKEWLLSLYNAVNETQYDNPNDITITTLDDVIYVKMKNDVSLLLDSELSLYEHQSVRRRITIGCNSKLNFRLTPIRPRGLACNCTFLSA